MLVEELRNLGRARWLYGYALLFAAMAFFATFFAGGEQRAQIVMAHLSLIVVPLISSLAAANTTYARRAYVEFLLTQPVSRHVVFLSSVTALLVGLAGSYALPVGLVMGMVGFPVGAAGRIVGVNVSVAITWVLVGVLVATVIDDRTRGLGLLLLVWFLTSVVYDALLLYALVALEEYPIDKMILAAVLANPVDAARLLLYQDLGLRFLLPVTLPPVAAWGMFAFWSGLLFVTAFRRSLRKDY